MDPKNDTVTRNSIQKIIAGQNYSSVSGQSEAEIVKSLSSLLPLPEAMFMTTVKLGQTLGTMLGLKSRQQCEKSYSCSYDKAVLSYFLATKQMELNIQTLYDTQKGSILEIKLPTDVFSFGGQLKIVINEEPQHIRVQATTEIKGQMFDWGKGSRILKELCTGADQYIEVIHLPMQ
jgi:hypothetical protein